MGRLLAIVATTTLLTACASQANQMALQRELGGAAAWHLCEPGTKKALERAKAEGLGPIGFDAATDAQVRLIQRAARECPPVQAMLGATLQGSGKYAEALDMLLDAAENGSVLATGVLGDMYALGQGTKQDYVEAYKWYSLAADAGISFAAKARDRIGGYMNIQERARAQRLVREWKDSRDEGHDGPEERLRGVKRLLDEGLITEAEARAKRREILDGM